VGLIEEPLADRGVQGSGIQAGQDPPDGDPRWSGRRCRPPGSGISPAQETFGGVSNPSGDRSEGLHSGHDRPGAQSQHGRQGVIHPCELTMLGDLSEPLQQSRDRVGDQV
jgi:hypothetical protein